MPEIPKSDKAAFELPPALKAEFIISAAAKAQFPESRWPEITLLGRSNAGKSSLLNRLLGRKALARVGAAPGRTRLINFFEVVWAANLPPFLLTDLPGYGYAAAPKSLVAAWRGLVNDYLTAGRPLKLALLLMDLRRKPGPEEAGLIDWLTELGIPTMLVGTKADKLSKSQAALRLSEIERALALRPWPFSSLTGQGRAGLLKILGRALEWPPSAAWNPEQPAPKGEASQ